MQTTIERIWHLSLINKRVKSWMDILNPIGHGWGFRLTHLWPSKIFKIMTGYDLTFWLSSAHYSSNIFSLFYGLQCIQNIRLDIMGSTQKTVWKTSHHSQSKINLNFFSYSYHISGYSENSGNQFLLLPSALRILVPWQQMHSWLLIRTHEHSWACI